MSFSIQRSPQECQILQDHKEELDALSELEEKKALPNFKKPPQEFASPEYRVKDQRAPWYVIALCLTVIAIGVFAFLGVPLLCAAGTLPMSGFLLTMTCISGVIAILVGLAILGCSTPKRGIATPRAFEIGKEQDKALEAKRAKKPPLKDISQYLDLATKV